jgi:hypothetical protein
LAEKTTMTKIIGMHGKIICNVCLRDDFKLPLTNNLEELIQCACGNTLGPLSSLKAKASGEGHTPVNADVRPLS